MASPDLTTEEGILAYLNDHKDSTWPQITHVKRHIEGSSGFVFRAYTADPKLPSIIVKHVQGYAARAQQWKLAQDRLVGRHLQVFAFFGR